MLEDSGNSTCKDHSHVTTLTTCWLPTIFKRQRMGSSLVGCFAPKRLIKMIIFPRTSKEIHQVQSRIFEQIPDPTLIYLEVLQAAWDQDTGLHQLIISSNMILLNMCLHLPYKYVKLIKQVKIYMKNKINKIKYVLQFYLTGSQI